MREEIIIYQPWGGLGDNLCHTVLPPLCKKYGVKCYLSNQNSYRNAQIYQFIWENNPDIDGRKDYADHSWAFNLGPFEIPGLNCLEVVQRYFGFEPEIHYPVIHYTPKRIPELENKTILDLSSISARNQYIGLKPNVERALQTFSLDPENTLCPEINQINCFPNVDTAYSKLVIKSLEHYADVIYSCKRLISFHSGQHALAAAIKNKTGCSLEIDILSMDIYMPGAGAGYHFKNTNYYDLHKF